MAQARGRRKREIRIEAIEVETPEESKDSRELGEEWVKFLAKTVNRLLELGELVNVDGEIKVNPKRGDK
jgi:hypothetical protein